MSDDLRRIREAAERSANVAEMQYLDEMMRTSSGGRRLSRGEYFFWRFLIVAAVAGPALCFMCFSMYSSICDQRQKAKNEKEEAVIAKKADERWSNKKSACPAVSDYIRRNADMPFTKHATFLENEYQIKTTGEQSMDMRGAYVDSDADGRQHTVRFTALGISPRLGWSISSVRVDDIDGVEYGSDKLKALLTTERWLDKTSAFPVVSSYIPSYSPYHDIKVLESELGMAATRRPLYAAVACCASLPYRRDCSVVTR